jgi:predicted nuclease of restriction endonuclease-like (RecB) superfamily
MVIDGEDHTLDLLFYHCRLRLVAVELKLGKFKAAHKGYGKPDVMKRAA